MTINKVSFGKVLKMAVDPKRVLFLNIFFVLFQVSLFADFNKYYEEFPYYTQEKIDYKVLDYLENELNTTEILLNTKIGICEKNKEKKTLSLDMNYTKSLNITQKELTTGLMYFYRKNSTACYQDEYYKWIDATRKLIYIKMVYRLNYNKLFLKNMKLAPLDEEYIVYMDYGKLPKTLQVYLEKAIGNEVFSFDSLKRISKIFSKNF